MKFLTFSFLAIFLLGNITEVNAQKSPNTTRNSIADWSGLFPEIAGCERVIQPATKNGKTFEQTAVYEREGYKKYQNENYFGCGLITLRWDPFTKNSFPQNLANFDLPLRQPLKIKGFDAYRDSPLCGNDSWIGSITIYFDKDKALIVSANVGAEKILELAETMDYKSLRRKMNKTEK